MAVFVVRECVVLKVGLKVWRLFRATPPINSSGRQDIKSDQHNLIIFDMKQNSLNSVSVGSHSFCFTDHFRLFIKQRK